MKIAKAIVFLSLIFGIPKLILASHILGGEITWSCLNNGKFVFELTIYRDCQGINYVFQQETLNIVGANLPLDANNQVINSITLNPNLNRFNSQNNGDLSPDCYAGGLSCNSGDATVQTFYYQSSPVQLNGIPPSTGWKFSYTPPCCRSNMSNFQGQNTLLISTMFPLLNAQGQAQNTSICMDNSPH